MIWACLTESQAPKREADRRRWGDDSRFLFRLGAKHQEPRTKLQRSSKSQASNLKTRCRCERCAGWFLSLALGASLELGDWELGAFCWALSFSKVEMRPAWDHLQLHS